MVLMACSTSLRSAAFCCEAANSCASMWWSSRSSSFDCNLLTVAVTCFMRFDASRCHFTKFSLSTATSSVGGGWSSLLLFGTICSLMHCITTVMSSETLLRVAIVFSRRWSWRKQSPSATPTSMPILNWKVGRAPFLSVEREEEDCVSGCLRLRFKGWSWKRMLDLPCCGREYDSEVLRWLLDFAYLGGERCALGLIFLADEVPGRWRLWRLSIRFGFDAFFFLPFLVE